MAVESLESRQMLSGVTPADVSLLNDSLFRDATNNQPSIVNGTPTSDYESVGIVGDLLGGFCSGTLIGSSHVLTAAHCADSVSNTGGTFEVGGNTYNTSEVFVHPNWSGDENDIAIYRLNQSVSGIEPSLIYRETPQVGQMLTLVGFGAGGTGDTGHNGDFGTKRVGTTPIDGVETAWITWNFDDNTESNTAPGDSGGPAFVEVDGVLYIAGITSGGVRWDAAIGDFSYDTRVDTYQSWVDSIVDDGPAEGAQISGLVWNDLDGDGQQNGSEPGLGGWTVYLDQNNNNQLDDNEVTQVSGTGGTYAFTGLAADTYTVAQVAQTGWQQTFPGSNGGDSAVQLVGNWDGHDHQYADVWGEGNFAYASHFGGQAGVDIIDISDPANPALAAVFSGSAGGNELKDVKVQNGIGFFASDNGGGVYVVDLSNPASPVELARISSANGGFSSIHNVSVDGDYLYEVDSNSPQVRVFNISNPASPTFVRTITSPSGGGVHDVTVLNGRLYTSVINGAGTTDIFDISDVANSAPLLGSFTSGSATHSNWPTADGNYLAVARETNGGDVKIWNISNPGNVTLAATLDPTALGIDATSPHNPVIDGNLLYVSWYEAGVQVFDISDPNNPSVVGSYDTFPGGAEYMDGAWGVYPLLGTDRVLVSDIQTGLYVLSVNSGGGVNPGAHSVTVAENQAVQGVLFGNHLAGVGPVVDVYVADFSDSNGVADLDGFTVDNSIGAPVAGLWHLSTGRGGNPGHSSDDSIYFGNGENSAGGGNYDVGHTAGNITSPSISLDGLVTAELSFNYFLQTELEDNYDVTSVMISQNGGAFSPLSVTLADPSNGFVQATADLANYLGSDIQLRFEFNTEDELYNGFEGWYVDDVTVRGQSIEESSSPQLAHGVVDSVTNAWQTVTLADNYNSMVVVLTPNYDSSSVPLVPRMRVLSDNSFEVRVDRADGQTDQVSAVSLHYVVVEEGTYTQAEHGVTMEAVLFDSTVTDNSASWNGQARDYSNSYTAPVVLGQVMSYNDAGFSAFWSRGTARGLAPTSSALHVGKHVGEDADTSRADETVGYIVLEAGSYNLDESQFVAGLGGDTVGGITNAAPYSYSLSGLDAPATAVVSQAAMDGNNGGWAVLHGADPLANDQLNLAIDEDQIKDTERSHTTEQVAYLVFDGTESPPPPPPASQFQIEVLFTDDTLTSTQQTVFTQAAQRWSEIIVGDIPDVNVPGFGLVDDVVIEASAPDIDGPGGILGQAGPTMFRVGSYLPAYGIMRFDQADVVNLQQSGQFVEVILHEMGHVIGIGTIWEDLNLLSDVGSDVNFVGSNAAAEYNTIFGTSGDFVPVEADFGPGTARGHWDEDALNNELMTGFLNSGQSNPISRITVAALDDMGYQIDLNAADTYSSLKSAGQTVGTTPQRVDTAAGFDTVGVGTAVAIPSLVSDICASPAQSMLYMPASVQAADRLEFPDALSPASLPVRSAPPDESSRFDPASYDPVPTVPYFSEYTSSATREEDVLGWLFSDQSELELSAGIAVEAFDALS